MRLLRERLAELAVRRDREADEPARLAARVEDRDLVAALSGRCGGSPVYISSRMVSDRTHTLLDDLTVADVSASLEAPVVPCLTMSDLARDLRQRTKVRKAA